MVFFGKLRIADHPTNVYHYFFDIALNHIPGQRPFRETAATVVFDCSRGVKMKCRPMSNGAPLKAGVEPYPGYRLVQLIGRGGFAEVWEASTPESPRVALKFLRCSDQSPAREIQSLQAIREVKHPNLIQINRVWTFDVYIVVDMELAEGSLLDLLDAYQTEFSTPIIAEQVILYLTAVADALDFLNSRQHLIGGRRVAIQHCDIKPSNLLLFGDVVKLADFGLSSLTSSSIQFHRVSGTLDYMAPEVFQGKLSDRTDQYALAVSYCHLRGGRLPFTDTPKKFDRSYVRPDPDLSMLSASEQAPIARGLARAPQDRWPSCTEMMRALHP